MVILKKGHKFYNRRCKRCEELYLSVNRAGAKCWKCRTIRLKEGVHDYGYNNALAFMRKFFTLKELGLK